MDQSGSFINVFLSLMHPFSSPFHWLADCSRYLSRECHHERYRSPDRASATNWRGNLRISKVDWYSRSRARWPYRPRILVTVVRFDPGSAWSASRPLSARQSRRLPWRGHHPAWTDCPNRYPCWNQKARYEGQGNRWHCRHYIQCLCFLHRVVESSSSYRENSLRLRSFLILIKLSRCNTFFLLSLSDRYIDLNSGLKSRYKQDIQFSSSSEIMRVIFIIQSFLFQLAQTDFR